MQGAVASSIRSAAWALEGGHARSARRGGRPTCTRASGCCLCMLEKPLLQSDLDSFLLREIQDTLQPCTCAPHLLLCALSSRPAILSATSKGSEISRLEATVTSFLMMKS